VVQLRDAAGKPVQEWRGYAMNGIWAPELWRAGDSIDDRSVLRLARPSPPGPYSVWLGLARADGVIEPAASTGADVAQGLVRIGQVPQ
jgi:hypothetical protein